MLFKMALKNIKKSIKDYTVYFFTLILGVAIFYVFNAIESQTVLIEVSSSTVEFIKLMTSMLSGVSVFVSFILGFLIIYASRFLIKRRNKEFGIYLTLGMSKRKISLILFFETLLIGIISLVIGIGTGVVLSQFMSVIVVNLFEADMTKFKFIFSENAFIKTIIYFIIMYVLVMLFNTISISKCKLIDLINYKKKSEKIKMKNPIICVIVFIISVLILSTAYYMVTIDVTKFLSTANKIFVPIILGVIGTVGVFWSVSGLLLKIFSSMKNIYYKNLNMFVLRQFSSKINTTVISTSVICIMLFITLCVLSVSFSLKSSMNNNLKELAPKDINMMLSVNLNEEDKKQGYNDKQIENSKYDIIETFNKFDFDIKKNLKDCLVYNVYEYPGFNLEKSLGEENAKVIHERFPFMMFHLPEQIMRVSDYNKVARVFGNEEFSLEDDEYIIVADFKSMVNIRNSVLVKGQEINVFGKTLKPKYNECKFGYIQMSANHITSGVFIVPDNIVDEKYIATNMLLGDYNVETKKEKMLLEEKINALSKDPRNAEYILPSGNSKIVIYEASIGLSAMVIFIGLYLGIIFLIASAAILALKELSESADNKERFEIIRKIGADDKMINKALFLQIGIFFLFPVLLASIHSIFGIKVSLVLLETFGVEKILQSILLSIGVMIVIYGSYFFVTYVCSKNIIKENR